MRNEIAKYFKTPAWTKENLDNVLGKLNINKAKDPAGLSNIIFRKEIAGDNLKKSIFNVWNY